LLRQRLEYRLEITQARDLFDSGKKEEAKKALDDIRPELFEPISEQMAVRRLLGWEYAREYQWADAITNLGWVIQNDDPLWHSGIGGDHLRYSTALVAGNDFTGYNQYRQNLVADLFHTNDAGGSWFLCRLVTLTPADSAFMQSLTPFVEAAFTATNFNVPANQLHDYKAFHIWNLAMVAYRNGEYGNALSLTDDALAQRSSDNILGSYIHSVRAMAFYRLGQVQEAGNELRAAKRPVDAIFKNGAAKIAESQWFGWHIARIYINEAENMMKDSSAALE
jgi:hypothetical protein